MLVFISLCKQMLTVLKKIIERKQESFLCLYMYFPHFRRDGRRMKSAISTINLFCCLSVPAVICVLLLLGAQATLSIFSFITFLYPFLYLVCQKDEVRLDSLLYAGKSQLVSQSKCRNVVKYNRIFLFYLAMQIYKQLFIISQWLDFS